MQSAYSRSIDFLRMIKSESRYENFVQLSLDLLLNSYLAMPVESDMATEFTIDRYTIGPSPSYPLHILANRYMCNNSSLRPHDGYTLVFMHAIGLHKETWEVTIRHLFALSKVSWGSGLRIREVYCIESPNHGESAILNEEVLRTQYAHKCNPEFSSSY